MQILDYVKQKETSHYYFLHVSLHLIFIFLDYNAVSLWPVQQSLWDHVGKMCYLLSLVSISFFFFYTKPLQAGNQYFCNCYLAAIYSLPVSRGIFCLNMMRECCLAAQQLYNLYSGKVGECVVYLPIFSLFIELEEGLHYAIKLKDDFYTMLFFTLTSIWW